jgi:hypothetical protein
MIAITRPDRSEAAEYYFTYIDKVRSDDILQVLEAQSTEALSFFQSIPDSRSLHRYGPDKWTIREVAAHLNDTERLFLSRAFWFARGFDTPLPSFDQHVAIAACGANDRPWNNHIEGFRAVRAATLTFLRDLPDDAWRRRGVASDCTFTVRALAYIAAGHVTHHVEILRDRYL